MAAGREQKLQLYDKLIATQPEIERKGDTMPYTSVNGHMFSLFIKEDELILRLPPDELDQFLKKYATRNPVQYGAVMKEYAAVPAALLTRTRELQKYFEISFNYVRSLKPKPTAKGKKARAK
jgi:hypothetical protein